MIQLESIEHDYISLSLTSKCKVSPERRVLDLESEIMRGPGSIPLGVSFSLDFFHVVKPLLPILALLLSLCISENILV